MYAVFTDREVTIYRQVRLGAKGKLIAAPQVALKVPFIFRMDYYGGNAYDFSRDLSTIVYSRPGGQDNFYLLSPK